MCIELGIVDWLTSLFESTKPTTCCTKCQSDDHIRELVNEAVAAKLGICNEYIKRKINKRIADLQTQVHIQGEQLDNVHYVLSKPSELGNYDQAWKSYL